jgi:hypothetical protein
MKSGARKLQDLCLNCRVDAHARQCASNNTTRKPEELLVPISINLNKDGREPSLQAGHAKLPRTKKPYSSVRMA